MSHWDQHRQTLHHILRIIDEMVDLTHLDLGLQIERKAGNYWSGQAFRLRQPPDVIADMKQIKMLDVKERIEYLVRANGLHGMDEFALMLTNLLKSHMDALAKADEDVENPQPNTLGFAAQRAVLMNGLGSLPDFTTLTDTDQP